MALPNALEKHPTPLASSVLVPGRRASLLDDDDEPSRHNSTLTQAHSAHSLEEAPFVANSLDPLTGENDSAPLPPPASEQAPPSTSLTSPLALARELADRLEKHQNEKSEAWRLACALSLSIVDLLESERASDTAAHSGGARDDKSSAEGSDPFQR